MWKILFITMAVTMSGNLNSNTTAIEPGNKSDYIQIYDSSELTEDILADRNGNIIIEECVGIVLDAATGDEELLNAADPAYNYINYSDVPGIETGMVIRTYLIYNPDSNFTDDVIERFDYILEQ